MAEKVIASLTDVLPRIDAEKLTTENLTAEVARQLRESILIGRLAPGQVISTRALAEAFGVSMTPTRNALDRLAQEGIVVMHPRQGTRVSAPASRDIEECFDLRIVLEGYATEQLARRLTAAHLAALEERWEAFDAMLALMADEAARAQTAGAAAAVERVRELVELDQAFHQYIIEASENQRLAQLYNILDHSLVIGRMYFLGNGPFAGQTSHQQHRMIIDALATHDPIFARATAEFHVRQSRAGMLAALAASEAG